MIEDKFKKIDIPNDRLNELIETYLEQMDASPATKRSRKHALEMFSKFHDTRKKFLFQVEDIKKYRYYIEGILKKSSLTVRNYVSALNLFCKYLVDIGELEKNPVNRITYRIKGLESKKNFITLKQIDQLLLDLSLDIIELRPAFLIVLYLSTNLSLDQLRKIKKKDITKYDRSYALIFNGVEHRIDNKFNYLINEYLNSYNFNENSLLFFNINEGNNKEISERSAKELIIRFMKRHGFKERPIDKLKQSRILFYYYKNRSEIKLRERFDLKTDSVVQKYLDHFKEFRSS